MHVEIGTETPKFLFWEYLFQNFGILSLQCKSILKKGSTNDQSYTLTLFDFGWGVCKTEGGETNREED
jgi:hypothetical protein